MRPRPNGRGNWSASRPIGSSRSSFNEAAAEWPRESFIGVADGSSSPGFNEAAAEWPRESGNLPFITRPPACFNEAAAEWPREWRGVTNGRDRHASFNEAAAEWPRECLLFAMRDQRGKEIASMRPRPNGRGNSGTTTVANGDYLLQ